LFLQNSANSENVLVDPYCETSYQAMNVKAEEVSDAEEEEDPVPTTFLEMKTEPEVSCMCTVRQITQICRSAACLFGIHLCLCT
jgi:uncharacterized Zn-finger protein